MLVMSLDTHAFVKSLTASGMPEAQAEAVTDLVRQARESDVAELATKADLASGIAMVDRRVTEAEGRLTATIAETKTDLLKWTIGMVGGAVLFNAVTVVGAMLALLRMTAH
jgi:hypothetical protein